MTDTVADFITLGRRSTGRRRSERLPGTAADGVFVPMTMPAVAESHPLSRSAAPGDGLRLADPQQFISSVEQEVYDHLTGLLLDTTISGVVSKEYVYLSSSLNGEILATNGRVYDFSVSDTFVSFSTQAPGDEDQTEGFIETDGEPLDSSEIGKLFHQVCRELALKEGWRSVSGLNPGSGISFGSLDVELGGGSREISLNVETRFGEWRIELRGNPGAATLNYTLTDLDRDIALTRRTADAVLSDIAEECSAYPEPSTVLEAMVRVAAAVA